MSIKETKDFLANYIQANIEDILDCYVFGDDYEGKDMLDAARLLHQRHAEITKVVELLRSD